MRIWSLLFFILTAPVFSLYNGNPSSPMMPEKGVFFTRGWFSLKAGYEWDDIFKQQVTMQKRRPLQKKKVQEYRSTDHFGTLTAVCADRVEVYTSLGNRISHVENHPYDGVKAHYVTDRDFAWVLGARALLAYWGDVQFGLAASYLHFSPALDSIKIDGVSYSTSGSKLHYREWQVGAGFSYHSKVAIPYIGMKYSDSRSKFFQLESIHFLFPNERFTLKNKHELGLVLGVGLAASRAIDVNAEARFIDETALTVAAEIRF